MPRVSAPKNAGLKFNILREITKVTRQDRPRGLSRMLFVIYSRLLLWFYHMDERHNDHLAVTMEYESHLLINVDTADFLQWYLFFYGEYQPGTTNIIKRLFKPGFVAFDVGANIGAYALIMGWLAGDDGAVVALEPHPEIFKDLVENIALNRMHHVKTIQCGLSDTSGSLTLYAPEEGSAIIPTSSVHKPNVSGEQLVEIQIAARTLDELMEEDAYDRLDFVKIDTGGHDYKVLLGAENSIKQYRPYVIFEYDERSWKNAGCDFASAQSFFSELDYSLYVIQPGYLARLIKLEHASLLTYDLDILAVPRFAGLT